MPFVILCCFGFHSFAAVITVGGLENFEFICAPDLYAWAFCSQNQFFISGLSGDEIIRNRVLESLYRRIMRAYHEKKCFRVIIIIPLLPGFQGGLDDGGAASVRAIMHWQYRTISRGHNSILHNLLELLGPRTHDYISFYGLRSYGRLFDGGPVASSPVSSVRTS